MVIVCYRGHVDLPFHPPMGLAPFGRGDDRGWVLSTVRAFRRHQQPLLKNPLIPFIHDMKPLSIWTWWEITHLVRWQSTRILRKDHMFELWLIPHDPYELAVVLIPGILGYWADHLGGASLLRTWGVSISKTPVKCISSCILSRDQWMAYCYTMQFLLHLEIS